MKQFIQKLPKTSISLILGAILVYVQAKSIIGNDEAILISQLLVGLGIATNIYTKSK